MAQARFSIGIDLGTTNSALAFAPLHGEARSEVLELPQWQSLSGLTVSRTLPSFLYLPEDAVAAKLQRDHGGGGVWIVGRLARHRARETPPRVAHSAVSLANRDPRPIHRLPWGNANRCPTGGPAGQRPCRRYSI